MSNVVIIEYGMDDLVRWADTIGIVAGILVMSSSIPQIIKSYKTKKMSDLTIYLMSLIASGLFLWIIYGLIRSDLVIIGTNAAGLCLNVTLLAMKLRYDRI
jgi:MtN3 and saliva related transmembrane protein